MMMRRRVRFLRSSSSRLVPAAATPPAGTAMVRPVAAAIMVVAAAPAAAAPMTLSEVGVARLDGTSVGEAEEVRPQLLGRSVARGRILGHRLHDHGLERGGTAGLATRGSAGSSRTCFDATATGESPVKGGRPTAIS